MTFDKETYAGKVSKFIADCRSLVRSGEGFSRDTLAALLNNDMTIGTVDAMLVAKFKPRLPSGKVGTSRSSLRNADGGEAAKKAVDRIEKAFDACNSDVEAIATAFRPLAVAFATNAEGSVKSMSALLAQLKTIETNHAESLVPAEDTDGEGTEEQDAPVIEQEAPLATMANRLRLAISEADSATIAEAHDALVALQQALSGTVAYVAAEQEAIAA